jgi:hypothetical protein
MCTIVSLGIIAHSCPPGSQIESHSSLYVDCQVFVILARRFRAYFLSILSLDLAVSGLTLAKYSSCSWSRSHNLDHFSTRTWAFSSKLHHIFNVGVLALHFNMRAKTE